jgi:hypothetical protein
VALRSKPRSAKGGVSSGDFDPKPKCLPLWLTHADKMMSILESISEIWYYGIVAGSEGSTTEALCHHQDMVSLSRNRRMPLASYVYVRVS